MCEHDDPAKKIVQEELSFKKISFSISIFKNILDNFDLNLNTYMKY